MDEAVYITGTLVLIESFWRYQQCPEYSKDLIYRFFTDPLIILDVNKENFTPSILYLIAYLLSIGGIFINMSKFSIFKSSFFKDLLIFIHAIDSITMLLIGYALFYQNNILLCCGVFIMSKLFAENLLKRLVTIVGDVSTTTFSIMTQTTKNYLHHFGSILFLSNEYPTVIIITILWRILSLSGHAILALRGTLPTKVFDVLIWQLSHYRNIAAITIFIFCCRNDNIRRGFAISAIGHIAYIGVRLGAVFRLGSIYVEEGAIKEKWQLSNDWTKLKAILQFKYPFLSIEVLVSFLLIIYFLYLRITTTVHVTETNCIFL